MCKPELLRVDKKTWDTLPYNLYGIPVIVYYAGDELKYWPEPEPTEQAARDSL